MTITSARIAQHTRVEGDRAASRKSGTTPATPTSRDASIDLVRSVLLCVVVALHAVMVGVSIGADGPVLENALEAQDWFAPVTWLVQIMPLFFLIGGFASVTQWRRMRARGARSTDYIRGRLDRLLRPALAMVGTVTVALTVMLVAGVPAEIVATAGFRISQPLWFLAVYLGCSALVPLMVRAHESAPVRSAVVLLVGVISTDAVRFVSGVDAFGILNLAFVWLLLQQLGFWLADGRIDALSRRARVIIAVSAFCALVALTTSGLYSPDMLVNLNPPTLCLVLLGAIQLMVFSLFQPRLRAWAAQPKPTAFIAALGSRSMTVYLWHMPVLIALAAGLLALNAVAGIALPAPLSLEWWLSRPLWLLAAGLAVAPIAVLLGRIESAPARLRSEESPRRIGAAAALGVTAVVLLLASGFTVWAGAAATIAIVIALRGFGRAQRSRLECQT